MNYKLLKLTSFLVVLMGLSASQQTLAQDTVNVDAVNPNAAPPATYGLDLVISGSGFDKSAKVRFLRAGTETTADVQVNRTKVTGSSQISVNIDIPDTAEDQVEYDIEVQMSRGRGGKGTTLFKVDSTASAAPNNDGLSISMICAIDEYSHPLTTIGNDVAVNPAGGVGSWIYTDDMEKILCKSGGVVSGRLAGLRLRTDGGGNINKSMRFVDFNFNLDTEDCGDDPLCKPPEPELLLRLPVEWLMPSPDTVQIDVRPYADAVPPQNHIHLMEPGEYKMLLEVQPKGFEERYLIQSTSASDLPEGMLPSHSCAFSKDNVTEDVTVYIWQDGIFSGSVPDGLPDGYTVTTGTISDTETEGHPPTVTAGFSQGLVCSNVGLNGEPCPGGKKNQNALCHTLGKVPLRFTMHMEYPQSP